MALAVLCFNIKPPGSVMVGPESDLPGFFTTLKNTWLKRKGIEPLKDEQISLRELL